MTASALETALLLRAIPGLVMINLGMLLGWVKWKTNSLYPSMLIHFLHNFIVVMFFWGWH